MKQIKAYIKPHKLDDVTRALQKVERLRGMSVVEVKGFGRKDEEDSHHLFHQLLGQDLVSQHLFHIGAVRISILKIIF